MDSSLFVSLEFLLAVDVKEGSDLLKGIIFFIFPPNQNRHMVILMWGVIPETILL